ncbi:hypothetical protein BOX15_Mlig024935g3 [Macrostomum lignano]|uniref:Lsm14-like N-terminal domain-containing protein n=1 Tax=Macrostomum lignano TaxID=282301 RepID=A0A267HAD0_9PLAT|nr:hypothetical protein BOX15_Mlig024935g3 [Macrostomum lignano]
MSSFVGAKLQLDCGPSVGTFVGTIVDVSDEKLTLKNALRNGLPSDTGLVTLHRSSIVSITMLRSPGEQASDSTVSTASTTLQQVKDKENKIDHRVIEASLQEKTQQQQQQQQARREAARERLMSIPNATPVYICQNSPICPGKGGGGSGGNGQNGRHKGSEASKPKGVNGSGDFTTSNGRSNKDRNLPVSPTGRRQVNSGGNPATHQHVRARSELVTNYISCVNNSIGATNNTTSSSSPTTPNGIAVDQSESTVWFLANGDSDLRVPAVSDHFLETVLLAAEKLGLSMARMAECCGRSVADFLINQIASPYPLYQQTRQLNQLSLQSQQQHRQNLQFAVIIGGGRRGQFGLAAARHLASRGASVCAYITATDPVDRDQLGQEIRLYRSTGCPLVEHSRDLPWILDCVLLASDQVDSPAHPLAQWFRACRAPLACLAPPAGNPACLSPRYNIHCCLPIAPSTTTAASSTSSKLGANYLCDLGVTRDAFQAAGLRGFAPGGLFNLGSVVHLVPSLK